MSPRWGSTPWWTDQLIVGRKVTWLWLRTELVRQRFFILRVREWSQCSQSCQTVNMVMSPMGLRTRNHCAGRGQQQFSSQSVSEHYGATSIVPTQKHQPLSSSKRRPHFWTHTCVGENKSLCHSSQWDLKPRMTVLAKASSNFTDRPTSSQLVRELQVSSDSLWLAIRNLQC
jgi:hypothetical protein